MSTNNQFHPDHRGNGIADFIMDWSEARGRQILAERSRDLPHVLRIGCMEEHNSYRKELHTRHGFQPVRYFFEMRRNLSEAIAAVTLPPGIVIRPWEPGLNQRTYEAFEEAFQDHWGHVPMSKEAWVGDLCVRRPWRKRGFATALLNQSMHAFRAKAMDYATLGVDSENPTGALGVYERVGFTPIKRSISFAKTIHEPQD